MISVKDGNAIFERDSVLFDKIQYSFPVLSGLLRAAIDCNRLNVLDFGGALGSSYYQNRGFLSPVPGLKWNIVEQEKFVKIGKEQFQDEILSFYDSIDECVFEQHPNVILISSTIQYLEDPHAILEQIVSKNIDYIIVDRTPFVSRKEDLLTIQQIPESIYSASYPAWFFNESKFLTHFTDKYDLIVDFDSFESWEVNDEKAQDRGFIFKIRG